ncbi:response regulator transcription factor [Pseudomonas sp. nanlin1]|uniref:response regulator transcription factor n=1 Tax=Pseudomonas sp. nanlin1 TaxID=3040605 RepID=UPI0038910C52
MYKPEGPGWAAPSTGCERNIATHELSRRELEVLHLASLGNTYKELALVMGISPNTVKFHMKNILLKLHCTNSRLAVAKGLQLGLVKLDAPQQAPTYPSG